MAIGQSVTSSSPALITYQDYIGIAILCLLMWILVFCDALQPLRRCEKKNAVRIGGIIVPRKAENAVDGG